MRVHSARSTVRMKHRVLRLRRREGAEVVLRRAGAAAASASRSSSSARGIHQLRFTSNGDGRAAVVDAIAVRARQRRVAGVEVGRRLLDRHDGDLVGQTRVQRLGCARRRRAALDVRRRDLAERVHAGVGAAGDRERVVRRERRRERLPERALDRRPSRLHRPALERRAVVLERHAYAHVRPP